MNSRSKSSKHCGVWNRWVFGWIQGTLHQSKVFLEAKQKILHQRATSECACWKYLKIHWLGGTCMTVWITTHRTFLIFMIIIPPFLQWFCRQRLSPWAQVQRDPPHPVGMRSRRSTAVASATPFPHRWHPWDWELGGIQRYLAWRTKTWDFPSYPLEENHINGKIPCFYIKIVIFPLWFSYMLHNLWKIIILVYR